jgi:hypothetical protein
MKFQVLDIIPHLKNPVTGEIVSTADRLNQVVQTARRAEELGYDSFSVGRAARRGVHLVLPHHGAGGHRGGHGPDPAAERRHRPVRP